MEENTLVKSSFSAAIHPHFRFTTSPMPTSRYQSGQVPQRPLLDNFRLADRTKAEESRHIDAARLRDRALQPASGALRRYSSIVGPNDD